MKNGKTTLFQRIRYRFDYFISRRGSSIFLSLVLVFCFILSIAGILRVSVYFLHPEIDLEASRSIWTNIYLSFLQMADPGNMALDLEASLTIKAIGIMAGIAGMIMFSALIALITTALDQKIQELKKGHSKVLEKGHTLVLGWNEQRVTEILRELIEANESENNPSVVILSEYDKSIMDDYLAVNLRNRRNTKIITRSGNISSLVNLDIVSVHAAKSVIVLSDCHDGASKQEKEASDAKVIKAILAVLAHCPQKNLNIVAELFDERNRRILEDLDNERITTIDAQSFLAKIIVQTSRSRGLSMVYSEILSFYGCELYFHNHPWPDIAFGDLCLHFADGVPIGIRSADGVLNINPSSDTRMHADDSLLILAEDDSSVHFQETPIATFSNNLNFKESRKEVLKEKELILGWNPKAACMVKEYGDYVLPGSSIDIMLAEVPDTIVKEIEALDNSLDALKINLIELDPLDKQNLLSLDPAKYNNIIILGQNNNKNEAEQSDAETLMILLLLKNIFKQRGKRSTTKLIAEVLESRNRELVSRAGVDNFVISNQLVSMIMAQISENKDINLVYEHLLKEEGYEIYIKPASLYLDTFPQKLNFTDIMKLCQLRKEICIGVKQFEQEQNFHQNFGIALNPPKNEVYTIIDYDEFIVLAEDET